MLIIGLALGLTIGLLYGKQGRGASNESLEGEIRDLNVEIDALREKHDAELERNSSEHRLLLSNESQMHHAAITASQERFEVERRNLETRLEDQKREFDERIKLSEANRKQLTDEMATISQAVLEKTSERLEESIEQRRKVESTKSKTELDKRTAEISNVVKPVKEKLDEVNKKVESLEKERSKAQGQLGEQIKSLREGVDLLAGRADGLTAALRKPSGRGSWGEVQLRNVVELAGMLEYCDFETQVSVDGGDGILRPDLIVNMPGNNQVIVDAKAPMDAFLEAQEADSDEERDRQLSRHARQVKDHINKLRAKNYQDQFDKSPELVVMFIPSEGIYHAALAADPRLLEHGVTERVLVATPTTLIGLLRAISYGWGQEQIAESAQEIASIGRELHRRIITFSEPLAALGRSMGSAVTSYNKAIASYDSRVVPQLKRIEEAGAKSNKEMPDRKVIESQPVVSSVSLASSDPLEIEETGDSEVEESS